jgi:hypothetical protein
MDRWEFLSLNIPKYLDNPFIDEIVISDENGNDAQKINENFSNEKIKIYFNEQKLGAFHNKEKVVSLAKNEYVCLMDSDNFAPVSYFEAWQKEFKPDKKIVYCPSNTIPQKNHTGFDFKKFIGKDINKKTYKHYSRINTPFFNTGNYIFEKNFYLSCKNNEQYNYESICYCLDVMYKNWLMLENDAVLLAVKDMEYHHIVHSKSYYLQANKTIPNIKHYINLIKSLYA